ncbi:HNH endonuclease [Teichococcus oryzae]|uniref:HNH endonuclease n=1 Tax=Teichococcus oryzae TaxID=1608942 RepID=A0A5B2T9B0_9PROT|nr:HNH endonuclease [Pseudoroseomonas oryzae]KAA2211212.1 HNH endonuclease [Pseudoroseomonas oryzae]
MRLNRIRLRHVHPGKRPFWTGGRELLTTKEGYRLLNTLEDEELSTWAFSCLRQLAENFRQQKRELLAQAKVIFDEMERALFAEVEGNLDRRCLHCGSRDRLQLDHVFPRGLNGRDCFSNYQRLCIKCNNRKGQRWRDDRPQPYQAQLRARYALLEALHREHSRKIEVVIILARALDWQGAGRKDLASWPALWPKVLEGGMIVDYEPSALDFYLKGLASRRLITMTFS